ncbi:MAG: ABC transporter ATP-binding protein, partial [Thermomicrobiales bacterium]
RLNRRAQMMGYAMVASSQGLFGLGTAFAFGASALLFRDGTLTLGTVYLIFRYTDMLRQPTEQIRNEMQDFQQADASIGRIESLFDEEPTIRDGTTAELPRGPLAVDLEHVSFGYSSERLILDDIDVHVAPGRVLGIVGRTGSGKTTLTRLLPRFHDPQAGAVRLAGVDIRDVQLHALRSRIGLVTQDIHLFDATLRHNLTLFDDSISDDRLLDVIAAVGLGDWLRELPNGLDSMLGSDASGLSAGQAQILTCARVLLREPDLVILDEASSRLDPATERLLHNALGTLLSGRTGIIVAHRLVTFSYADDMLVLEDGRVKEHGSRIELEADSNSHYAQLLRVAAEEVSA